MNTNMNQTPTLIQVQSVTDQYTDSPLECDGLTNVLHFYLTRALIKHHVIEGYIEDQQENNRITPHRWITVQTQKGPAIIDYRARMWLGEHEDIPHGVFFATDYPRVRYHGQEIKPPLLSEEMISLLVERPIIPPEWKKKYHL